MADGCRISGPDRESPPAAARMALRNPSIVARCTLMLQVSRVRHRAGGEEVPLLDAFLTMMSFSSGSCGSSCCSRSLTSSGARTWAADKHGWLAFVIILPFLGVFVYLIAHGRQDDRTRRRPGSGTRPGVLRAYVQEAARQTSPADELTKLADLRDRGVISEADFQQGKDKILKAGRLTRSPRRATSSALSY